VSTAQSTSTTTGSIVSAGGIGVAKDMFIGGAIDVASTARALDYEVENVVSTPSNASASTVKLYNLNGLLKTVDSSGNTRGITNLTIVSDTFTSNGIGAGTYYADGYYFVSTTAVNVNTGSTAIGGATAAYGAHAFIVSSGAITGTGVTVTVSGTSYSDSTGTRTATDSEVLTTALESSSVNQYYETAKKWIGTVTFTYTGSTPAGLINYGLNKYQDLGDVDFDIIWCESTGLAGAADSTFNLELLKHTTTGWTYAATGFTPQASVVVNFGTLYNPENDLVSGEQFAFKRVGTVASPLASIAGSGSEGLLWRITTGTNNSVQSMVLRVGCKTK
jgi:hypothetical protein